MRVTQNRPLPLPRHQRSRRQRPRRRRAKRPREPPPEGDQLRRRAGVQRLRGLVRAGVRLLPELPVALKPGPVVPLPKVAPAVRLLPAAEILQAPGP